MASRSVGTRNKYGFGTETFKLGMASQTDVLLEVLSLLGVVSLHFSSQLERNVVSRDCPKRLRYPPPISLGLGNRRHNLNGYRETLRLRRILLSSDRQSRA
jgi:hypothetical protein